MALVAHAVERGAFNSKAAGSKPAGGSHFYTRFCWLRTEAVANAMAEPPPWVSLQQARKLVDDAVRRVGKRRLVFAVCGISTLGFTYYAFSDRIQQYLNSSGAEVARTSLHDAELQRRVHEIVVQILEDPATQEKVAQIALNVLEDPRVLAKVSRITNDVLQSDAFRDEAACTARSVVRRALGLR